jgi:diguanylate cyclase (GGDEF)-like protein
MTEWSSREARRLAARGAGLSIALALALVLPLVVAVSTIPALTGPTALGWPLVLLALAALSAGAGLWLWRTAARGPHPPGAAGPAHAVSEVAPLVVTAAPPSDGDSPTPPGTPESAALLSTFSRVLAGVEQQASEIERFADKLDLAYKDIQTSSARLKEFSFKDEVTGLYNRRFFSIRLEEEVSRYRRFNHPVSVVLLDLDGFKAVNDELGHGAGDETLRGVADVLMKNSRGINVICRYGGDEFAILLVETSKTGARLYADRIRYVLPGYRFTHGRRVTASFGIASVPEDVAPQADELIRAADEALYAAKRSGKNRVSVYESLGTVEASGRGPSRDGL